MFYMLQGSEDSDLTRPQMYVQKGIIPLLDGAGVDLVLSGHSHSYERSLLIRGHYGSTSTWDPEHMLVDGGLGQLQEDGKVDGRYRKPLGLRLVGVIFSNFDLNRGHDVRDIEERGGWMCHLVSLATGTTLVHSAIAPCAGSA